MEKSLNLTGLTASDVGRSFALVAGVSEYSYLPSQYKELDPAKEDLRKLQNYLEKCEFFDEIVLLKNEDMNLDNLSFFLQSYFPDRLKKFPKSRFLFAYSGHGFTDGEDSYLMEYTAQSFNDKVNSINVMSLKVFVDEVVKSAEASDDYVLVLLNACYAGTFLKRPFGGKVLLPKHSGAHAITAGGTQEQTWHDPKIGTGSVFFEKFFAGLDGHADLYPKDLNGDGLITVDELATYITEEVKISTDQNQNPQSGDISRHGSLGGFFFLNRRRQVDAGLMPKWNPKTGKSFGEDSLPNEIICKDGAPMMLIPAGEFEMGSNDDEDDEMPVHTVYLDAFYIDEYEVTNAQYKKFMDATGYKSPYYWNDSNYNAPNNPVVGVDWNDAKAYA
ncbi:MAG: formylglycine-generating enzyme family protein, partial [Candidatus Poribacteria bacterium]